MHEIADFLGDHPPFDTIEQHLMSACGVRRRLLARRVLVEAGERGMAAGDEFVRQIAERTAADDVGELLERIGRSETRMPTCARLLPNAIHETLVLPVTARMTP